LQHKILSEEAGIFTSINNSEFDKLLNLFSKEELVQLSKDAQTSHNSWFFSGWQTKYFAEGLEGILCQKLIQNPSLAAKKAFEEEAEGILKDYFELDESGKLKQEDVKIVEGVFKDVFEDINDSKEISVSAFVKDHTVVVDQTVSGENLHFEAKFDSEKFGDWIKHNLVEGHYVDHYSDHVVA
jgi:hypothetical protein